VTNALLAIIQWKKITTKAIHHFLASDTLDQRFDMRWFALIPALLCTGALILSFLCLLAGRNTHFLNDFPIVTVRETK
jgi:hypothetical protein